MLIRCLHFLTRFRKRKENKKRKEKKKEKKKRKRKRKRRKGKGKGNARRSPRTVHRLLQQEGQRARPHGHVDRQVLVAGRARDEAPVVALQAAAQVVDGPAEVFNQRD